MTTATTTAPTRTESAKPAIHRRNGQNAPMATPLLFALTLLFVGFPCASVSRAQEDAGWRMPEGAYASLGLGRVDRVVHSPDGTRVGVVGGDDWIQLNDARTGEMLQRFAGNASQVLSMALSPSRVTLATGSDDGSIRLWNLATREVLGVLEEVHNGRILAVAFSADGRMLASGGEDRTVRLWALDTGRLERTLDGHAAPVLAVAFSPDGQTLASRSEDHEIRLWDLDTGTHRHTLLSHPRQVLSMSFSPDGRTLASGEGWPDHSIRLWDVDSGRERAVLAGHASPVLSVAFSPDSRAVTSGSRDGRVALWDVSSGPGQGAAEEHLLEGVLVGRRHPAVEEPERTCSRCLVGGLLAGRTHSRQQRF